MLDCLEFDDALRFVDALDDVAFLAMDLERLGRPDLAEYFHDAYVEFSADPAPPSLWHHYLAYRAFVRVKVACLRHEQGAADAADAAAQHLRLCTAHLRTGSVRLALVGGLPGTGKSTVAGQLADLAGAVVLSSDRLRKELVGLSPTTSAAAAFGDGLYRPERTDEVYPSCCTGRPHCWPAASRWCSTPPGPPSGTVVRRFAWPVTPTPTSSSSSAGPRRAQPPNGSGPGPAPRPMPPWRSPSGWPKRRTRGPKPPSSPRRRRCPTPSRPHWQRGVTRRP